MGKRLLFIIMTFAFGAFAGAFAWTFFFLMNVGITLLWEVAPRTLAVLGLPAVVYPLAFCTLGGLCIGLFAKRSGPYPADMNTVMAQVKKSGRYDYDHLGASFFGALLPLLFGGSIGPEAGLTGVIAGLCTWVGDRLRFVGSEMRELAEAGTAAVISAVFTAPLFGMAVPLVGAADESGGVRSVSEVRLGVPKAAKIAVYLLAVAGALATMMLLGHLFGTHGGLPRFDHLTLGLRELAWGIPFVLIGTVVGWLFFPFGAAARFLSEKLSGHLVIKPVIAGVVLGTIGIGLPFALFAGETQSEQLTGTWTTYGAGILLLTGVAKVFTTQFCLNMGWRGGHFFPLIFAGVSLGYGLALLTGADPGFSLCAVTGALMGAVMRQPIMTVLLLFLVFPLDGAFVLLVAAALGSLVPVPRSWEAQDEPQEPEHT